MTIQDPARERVKGLPNPEEWMTVEEILDPAFDSPAGQRPALTSENPWTADDVMRGAFSGTTWQDFVGFADTVKEVRDLTALHRAADDFDLGIADEEQQALLLRAFADSADQPDGWMQALNIGVSIGRDMPAFMQEMLVGGLAAGGAKVAVKGAKAVALQVARDRAEKSIIKMFAKGAVQGTQTMLAETAIGAVTGGGRLNVNVLQRTLRGIGVDENEAGELTLALDASKPSFLAALPAALVDTLIEPISERSGAALGKAVGALPFMERVSSLQAALVRRARKAGYTSAQIVKRLQEQAGWHGFLQEFGEELYGDALRAGAGTVMGDEQLADSLSYEWEELAGMAMGLGAVGGAMGSTQLAGDVFIGRRRDKRAEAGGIPEWARGSMPEGDDIIGIQPTAGQQLPQPGTRIKAQTDTGPVEVEIVGSANIRRTKDMVDRGDGPEYEEILWARELPAPEADAADVESARKAAPARPAGAEDDPLAGKRLHLHPDPLEEKERTFRIASFGTANARPDALEVWPNAEQQPIIDFWAERGVDVVLVDVGADAPVKASNPRQGVVLVDAAAPMTGPESLPRLLAHEFVHELAKVDMPSFEWLERLVKRWDTAGHLAANTEAARLDMLAAGTAEAVANDPQRLREEALAYRSQDLWNTVLALGTDDKVDMLRELAAAQPTLFQRMKGWVRQLLNVIGFRLEDPVMEKLRALGVDEAEVLRAPGVPGGAAARPSPARDAARAREATLQAAAIAEAMDFLFGRPRPSKVVEPQGPPAPAGKAKPKRQRKGAPAPTPAPTPAPEPAEQPALEPPPWVPQPEASTAPPQPAPEPEAEPSPAPAAPSEPQAEPEAEAEAEAADPRSHITAERETRARIRERVKTALLAGEDLGTKRRQREFELTLAPADQDYLESLFAKSQDELYEEGIVLAARDVAQQFRDDPDGGFRALVSIYRAQPRLEVRTGDSAARQAYSTPAPLAWVASRLARISSAARVLEPTAGTGMLVIEAEPGVTRVNEIDTTRANFLEAQGFKPTQNDALELRYGSRAYDAIIMNPPFGTRPGVTYNVPGLKTQQIDHAIVMHTLAGLAPAGRAALIIGGQQDMVRKDKATDEERRDMYGSRQVKLFLIALRNQFNVTHHVQIAGELYERQGASWPVDLIIINGRKSPSAPPRADERAPAWQVPPRVYKTWDEVGRLLHEADSVVPTGDSRVTGGGTGSATEGGGGDVASVPRPPDATTRADAPADGGRPPAAAGDAAGGPAGRAEGGVGGDTPAAREGADGSGGSGVDGLASARGADGRSGGPADGLAGSAPVGPGPAGGGDGGLGGVSAEEQRAAADRAQKIRAAREARRGGKPAPAPPPAAPPAQPPAPRTPGQQLIDLANQDLDDLGNMAFSNPFIEPKVWRATIRFGAGLVLEGLRLTGEVLHLDVFKAKVLEFWRSAKAAVGARIAELLSKRPELLEQAYDAALDHQLAVDELVARDRADEAVALEPAIYPGAPVEAPATEPEVPAETALAPAVKLDESGAQEGTQVVYQPGSKALSVGTLTPANLARPTQEAIARLVERVGDIDVFVAERLQMTVAEVRGAPGKPGYFSAEQIDALALAMVQMDNGGGFVIADQTGVGKGRFVAGLIRYAHILGLVPLFVTERPLLYADMYRDLYDTGFLEFRRQRTGDPARDMRFFMTNTVLSSRDEETGETVLPKMPNPPGVVGEEQEMQPQTSEERAAAFAALRNGVMPPGFDGVFTTYAQLNPVKQAWTERHTALQAIAPKAFLILDESHNAGGSENASQQRGKPKLRREDWIRQHLVGPAAAVMYSSATWAKNPHVMGLYSRLSIGKFIAAIAKDSVPLMQIASRMLTRSGELIRREKSFAGINIEPVELEAASQPAEEATDLLRGIYEFDIAISEWRKDMVRSLAEGVSAGADNAIGQGGATATAFSALIHNVVKRLLLAAKCDGCVERIQLAIAKGEKAVVALATTGGSMLDELVIEEGLVKGAEFTYRLNRVFAKYLRRTLRVAVRRPDGSSYYIDLLPHLPDEFRQTYEDMMVAIEDADMSRLPVSPLDYIRHRLEAEPVKTDTGDYVKVRVGEITGRNLSAEFITDELYRLGVRSAGDAAKRKAITQFNDGRLDVLLINRSAASGVSMHSSSKFKDQRPRVMMLLQAEDDVNNVMQIFGRINRTGQVNLPRYELLMTSLPAEQRPMAALMRRMASLNANTSAGRKGSFKLDATDFINTYGDEAVLTYLQDNPLVAQQIFPKGVPEAVEGGDLARKFSGLLVVAPLELQETALDTIDAEYQQLIDEATQAGTNKLQVTRRTVVDGPLAAMRIQEASGTHEAEGAVDAERYKILVPQIPLTVDIVRAKLEQPQMVASRSAAREALPPLRAAIPVERERLEKELAAVDGGKGTDTEKKLRRESLAEKIQQADRLGRVLGALERALHEPIPVLEQPSKFGNVDYVVLGATVPPPERLAVTAGNVKLTLLSLNSGRQSTRSVRQWVEGYGAFLASRDLPTGEQRGEVLARRLKRRAETPTELDVWVKSGNLLRAASTSPSFGVLFLEMPDGTVREALLMPDVFDAEAEKRRLGATTTPEQAVAWLASLHHGTQQQAVGVGDGVRLTRSGASTYYDIEVQSRGNRKLVTDERILAIVNLERIRPSDPYRGQMDERGAVEFLQRATEVQSAPVIVTGSAADFTKWRAAQNTATNAVRRRGRQIFEAFDLPDEKRAHMLRRLFVRKMQRLYEYQRGIESAGGFVEEQADVINRERLMHGRVRERLRDLDARYVQKIEEAMAEAKVGVHDVDRYLYARHAPSRNEVIAERQRKAGVEDEEVNLAGSGMATELARKIVAEYETGENAAAMKRIGELVDGMMESALLMAVREGLISNDEFDTYITQWEHYVPLRTTMESRGWDLGTTGKGFEARGQEYNRAEGRNSLADSPLGYAIQQVQRTILRAERNRVGQAFRQLLLDNADLVLFSQEREGVDEDREHGEPSGLVEWERPLGDQEMRVKVEGQTWRIHIHDKLVARAMKNIGEQALNPAMRAIQFVMQLYGKLITQLDPDFIVRNAMRDYWQALLHLEADFPGLAADAASPQVWVSSWRSLVWYYRNPEAQPRNDWEKAARELARAGGLPGYYGLESLQGRLEAIQKRVLALQEQNDAKGALMALGEWFSTESQAVEGAMRLAAYRALRSRGVSVEKAAGFVKDMTVNFDQKGEWGAFANALYLFWNASVQGIYRVGRGMATSRRMRRMAGGIVVLGAINGFLQRLLGGDDEDGIPFYDKRSAFEKDTSIVLLVPGNGQVAAKIPLPYIYSALFRFGDHVSALLMGAETRSQALGSVWGLAASQLNPFGQEHSLLQLATPTIADLPLQVLLNEKWHGGPVYPDLNRWEVDTTPDSERVWARNRDDVLHRFTRRLSEFFGGDETEGGSLGPLDMDWSPESVRHSIEFVAGGLGKFASRTYTEARNAVSGNPVDWGNVPIIRTTVLSGQQAAKTEEQMFYRITDDVLAVQKKLKIAEERNNPDRYGEIERDYEREIELAEDAAAARARVKALRAEEFAATDNDERRELRAMIREEIREFNGAAYRLGLR